MRYIALDIETVRNEDVSWEAPEDKPWFFPPIPTHKIVSLSVMEIGVDNLRQWYLKGLCSLGKMDENGFASEESILQELSQYGRICSEGERVRFVTWYGGSFDFPVITLRALSHGIVIPWLDEILSGQFVRRLGNRDHVDLYEVFTSGRASRGMRLGHVCQALGLPSKINGIHGGAIQDLFDERKNALINAYCQGDVWVTGMLLLRYLMGTARISREQQDALVFKGLEIIRAKSSPRHNKWAENPEVEAYYQEILRNIKLEKMMFGKKYRDYSRLGSSASASSDDLQDNLPF